MTRYIDGDRLLGLLRSEEEEITAYLDTKPDDREAPEWRGQLQQVSIIRDCVLAMVERAERRAA